MFESPDPLDPPFWSSECEVLWWSNSDFGHLDLHVCDLFLSPLEALASAIARVGTPLPPCSVTRDARDTWMGVYVYVCTCGCVCVCVCMCACVSSVDYGKVCVIAAAHVPLAWRLHCCHLGVRVLPECGAPHGVAPSDRPLQTRAAGCPASALSCVWPRPGGVVTYRSMKLQWLWVWVALPMPAGAPPPALP